MFIINCIYILHALNGDHASSISHSIINLQVTITIHNFHWLLQEFIQIHWYKPLHVGKQSNSMFLKEIYIPYIFYFYFLPWEYYTSTVQELNSQWWSMITKSSLLSSYIVIKHSAVLLSLDTPTYCIYIDPIHFI